jgi:hypothetical protein
MPKLGLGLSLPQTRVTSTPAPSGIDVPTTSAFVAEFLANTSFNGYFGKENPTFWYLATGPNCSIEYDTSWYFNNYDGKYPVITRNSTATNPLFIPTTGWVDGYVNTAIFYTGSSPTIPYSTNSFIITAGFGYLDEIYNRPFTKINANTWQTSDGEWKFVGNDLGSFSLEYYNGKYFVTYTRARALSSGIPTFGWRYFGSMTAVPQ